MPPSLSHLGKLRLGTKADLLSCLESSIELADDASVQPFTDVTILDGAVVVNFLRPLAAKMFEEYALDVFLPYIKGRLDHVSRVDIVWDSYLENSLKSQTRSKHGKGVRRRVELSTSLPENWQQFLRINENKVELFSFLVSHLKNLETEKQLVTTDGQDVVCIPPQDISHLAPCDHKEADTRMILHVADVVNDDHQKVLLCTVDTDVVALAVAMATNIDIQELWIAYGTGKQFQYIPAHEIALSFGPSKSRALPFFHAYTGCDTVSAFGSRGKMSAWDTWKTYEEVTSTFVALSAGPVQISNQHIAVLERFTILLYDRTSSDTNVDEARKHLFTTKGRAMSAIPPTRAALIQHMKRVVYQGGYCWGKVLQVAIDLPSPGDWLWTDPQCWKPLWSTLPEASKSSRELLHCGYKKGCSGRCKCRKAALKCTALCLCDGECGQESEN